jgi:uncharacterized membrane protein YfcA
MEWSTASMALVGITFGAAVVNGALGYGFSSITVPLALLFLTNRELNPALVAIEVVLNGYVLFVNRAALRDVWHRLVPVVVGLVPGIAIGTLIIASTSPQWLKLGTYVVLVPLILVQAGGYRRAIRAERAAGLAFGGGLGVLYSVTTISGPPLALAMNNQGFTKQEFRAALGFVRVAESSLTAVAYTWAGLFAPGHLGLMPWIVPSIVVGVPLGTLAIRRVPPETFRRICMSFDAWIVSFGLSALLNDLHIVVGPPAFLVMALVIVIDVYLLYRFFLQARTERAPVSPQRPGRCNGVPCGRHFDVRSDNPDVAE